MFHFVMANLFQEISRGFVASRGLQPFFSVTTSQMGLRGEQPPKPAPKKQARAHGAASHAVPGRAGEEL
jgi:hypothetical protein